MMKKNILILLVGLFMFASCEKDIYGNGNTSMSIEQFSPVLENGAMKLSGKVSMPKEFDRETAKVGFYVAEFTSDMNEYGSFFYDSYQAIEAYYAWMNGEEDYDYYYGSKYFWIDELKSDGTFEFSFVPQLKQYFCVAFAVNLLEQSIDGQVLSSEPFFFTGEATAQLELVNPFSHQFKLSFTSESDIEVGLCWSATNTLPNVEDACIEGRFREYEVELGTHQNVTFDYLDFGDNDVVYLRGYIKKKMDESYDNYWGDYFDESISYKMIYSNVIEFRPKDLVININSKEEMQDFVNSLYVCEDSINNYYDYRGDDMWNLYRGKLNFNYEVQKEDWLDSYRMAEYGDSAYIEIRTLNCTIAGTGIIPYISTVSKLGAVKGMSLERCYDNYGVLEDIHQSSVSTNYGTISGGSRLELSYNRGVITGATYVGVDSNYGEVLASRNVYVYNNYGLVQDCIDVYGTILDEYGYSYEWNRMVNVNQSGGRIIDCAIETNTADNSYLICEVNYGYIENCLPNESCCATNNGIIKD